MSASSEWCEMACRSSWKRLASRIRLKGPPEALVVRPSAQHACALCSKTFGSLQAAASHLNRAHGKGNQVYRKIDDLTQCPRCCMEYHWPSRLVAHLVYGSKSCGRFVQECLPDIEGATSHPRAADVYGWKPKLPAIRAEGPKPQWPRHAVAISSVQAPPVLVSEVD